MIGYGFMGRAHSNAYKRLNDFFPVQHRPVLKAVCARNAAKAAEHSPPIWGYERVETDWRKVVEAPDIDLIDIWHAQRHALRDRASPPPEPARWSAAKSRWP